MAADPAGLTSSGQASSRPSEPTGPAIFLDASALFAAIWSAEGGGRMLLKLGEAGVVRLQVSSQVLAEIEGAIRRKAPERLADLALLLDRARLAVVPPPGEKTLAPIRVLLTYAPDARVLAAAWKAKADYFVTLDQKHFLRNVALVTAVPFPLSTPGDCLAWLRGRLSP